MAIIKAEIHKHSKDTLEKAQKNIQILSSATAQKKYGVLLNGTCFTESIVYKANITVNILGYKEKVYISTSETKFKVHHGNHKNKITS